MKIVILIGPPGCGKGTQSDFLQEERGLIKLSTGDMLRDIAKQDTELSRKVSSVMESGSLVTDDLIIKVIEQKILSISSSEGIVLDGFPRTLIQAEYLNNLINTKIPNAEIVIIVMEVDERKLLERIIGRFSCAICKAGYHEIFKRTKLPFICDQCGSGEFTRREDDREEVVITRLKKYLEDTFPIIDFYQKLGLVFKVDANQKIDQVCIDIVSCIFKKKRLT